MITQGAKSLRWLGHLGFKAQVALASDRRGNPGFRRVKLENKKFLFDGFYFPQQRMKQDYQLRVLTWYEVAHLRMEKKA